jgi:hypothetical protein
MRRSTVLFLAALAPPALAAETVRDEAVGLRFSVPKAWQRVERTSEVRAAQFRIPRAGKDSEDGELILFRFGTAKGGDVEDNVERWYAQFTQPDGRPSRDAAVVTTRTVGGLKVTVIDLSGTYMPQMGPMERAAKPGYRLLGAVVEGEGGPWFWRAVGPAATMARAKPGFEALVDSLEARR